MKIVILFLLLLSVQVFQGNHHFLPVNDSGARPDTLPKTKVNAYSIVPGSGSDTTFVSSTATTDKIRIKQRIPGTSRDTVITKVVPKLVRVPGKLKP